MCGVGSAKGLVGNREESAKSGQEVGRSGFGHSERTAKPENEACTERAAWKGRNTTMVRRHGRVVFAVLEHKHKLTTT